MENAGFLWLCILHVSLITNIISRFFFRIFEFTSVFVCYILNFSFLSHTVSKEWYVNLVLVFVVCHVRVFRKVHVPGSAVLPRVNMGMFPVDSWKEASIWNSFCMCSRMLCVNIIIFLIFFNSLLTVSTLSRMHSLSPRVLAFWIFLHFSIAGTLTLGIIYSVLNMCSYFCTFIAHESRSKCSKRTPNFTSL